MQITQMTSRYAEQIITWHYEAPYDIYNMADAYEELMESYFAITTTELIGFCCFGEDAKVTPGDYRENRTDMGLGLAPYMCGQNKGYEVVKYLMDYAIATYNLPLRLTVATFNKRAIKLYENLGFTKQSEFKRGERRFQIMTY